MIGLLFMVLFPAQQGQVYADPDALHRIDQQFVCPENLASPRAKIDALAKFDADMANAVENLTPEQLAGARMLMLRRHHCEVTLDRLKKQGVR